MTKLDALPYPIQVNYWKKQRKNKNKLRKQVQRSMENEKLDDFKKM